MIMHKRKCIGGHSGGCKDNFGEIISSVKISSGALASGGNQYFAGFIFVSHDIVSQDGGDGIAVVDVNCPAGNSQKQPTQKCFQ